MAVLGAKGRMGSTSVQAIEAADGLELAVGIDLGDSLDLVTEQSADVALVFTTPDVALDQVFWLVERGVHVVIGTSGFDEERTSRVDAVLADHPGVGVLVVPNFSIGAVLMMKFAGLAAPFFESVEVIEMHHPQKVDAPSGTATRTAEVIAAAREAAGSAPLPDATTTDPDGARGATVAGIPVHAVRARGFIASQEVILGGEGEILSLRHDSSTRESFMPGVVAALRWAPEHAGVTVGLEPVLGL
ncbi:4-hydroxy-tetrahydrodipicolinate reductase [Aeromicrobium sp. Root495]|nr:4-hydroxy-tetrahydrodipicolinate reductase [Aeromicrobium sp. Root495]